MFGFQCLSYPPFFFSSRRRHTRSKRDWSSDVCSSDLLHGLFAGFVAGCVMTAEFLGLNLLFGGRAEPGFIWQVFTQIVNQGARWGLPAALQIGRASCRERGEISLCGAACKQQASDTQI